MKGNHRCLVVVALLAVVAAISAVTIAVVPHALLSVNYTALSGSASDIQDAVDIVASQGGGNVYIPEGAFDFIPIGGVWSREVDGEPYVGRVIVPPGVNIFGAGMVDENLVFDETNQESNWKTILKLPYNYPTGVGNLSDEYDFFILRNPDKYTDKAHRNRLSGFAVIGYREELVAQGEDPMSGVFPTFKAIKIYGNVDFRVDHLLIKDAGGGAVDIKNDYYDSVLGYYGQGVIDHCKFINTAGWGCADDHPRTYDNRTIGYGVAFRLAGDAPLSAWEPDTSKVLGRYNRTVFIEDCYLQRWRHCVSSIACAHYVFRHNRINYDAAYGSLDAHGAYNNTGTRAVEIYDNIIDNPNPYDPRGVCLIRGGGGVLFNNTFGNYEGGIYLIQEGDVPECWCHDIWIWNNTYTNIAIPLSEDGFEENVDYFLRAPNLAEDGFVYVPYEYPHPLTEDPTWQYGDINQDGVVDDIDLHILSRNYGKTFSTWQYGDINMDGVVDNKDLYIIGRNYGKTFSLLSLSGIIAIAGIHTIKKRKQVN